MRKRNDCCDSFNEITLQIDLLSDYTNQGGLIASNLYLEMRIRVQKKLKHVLKKEKEETYFFI